MKVLVTYILTFCLLMPALAADRFYDNGTSGNSAGPTTRGALLRAAQTANPDLQQRQVEPGLNTDWQVLLSTLTGHADRFKQICADESRQFAREFRRDVGNLGHGLYHEIKQAAFAGLNKIDMIWSCARLRMNELVLQAGQGLQIMRQTAHEEVRELKRSLAARLTETN